MNEEVKCYMYRERWLHLLHMTIEHGKVRVSFCLAAKSDGTKLKPPVVVGVAKRDSKGLHEEHTR